MDVSDQEYRFDSSKSSGPGGADPRVLKELKRKITEALAKACNVPVQTGTCRRTYSAAGATVSPGWRAAPEGTSTTSQWPTATPRSVVEPGIRNKVTKRVNKSCSGEESMGSALESLAQEPAGSVASPDTAVGHRHVRTLLMPALGVPEEVTASATLSSVLYVLHATCHMTTLLHLYLYLYLYIYLYLTNYCEPYPYKGSLLRLIPCSDQTSILTAFAGTCPL